MKLLDCRKLFMLAVMIPAGVVVLQAQYTPVLAPTAVSHTRYIDQLDGLTADRAVEIALKDNAELAAMRDEAGAGESLLRQARLRPNPTLELSGTRQTGGPDYSLMMQGEMPLELGGRRTARRRVAEQELEIRRYAVLERERQLAYDVRLKFSESLAAIFKLKFAEEVLIVATSNLNLVSAQVTEGRRAPLEQNLELVELNRIRALRESSEGTAEERMFELRNLLGMNPEQPLRLRGNFDDVMTSAIPSQDDAVSSALKTRPDIAGARAIEGLASARVEQAKAEGRIDADLMLGYQRMKSGYPLLGVQEGTGALLPIEQKFHFFTFGIRFNLPVLNRNQGMIAAAALELDAARNRRQFGELTIRREVAAAYAKYNRAVRAMEIFRIGVRLQAKENLGVVRQTYEVGSKTLLDYIAEQRRFIETESAFIDAQLEVHHTHVDLLRAANSGELTNK